MAVESVAEEQATERLVVGQTAMAAKLAVEEEATVGKSNAEAKAKVVELVVEPATAVEPQAMVVPQLTVMFAENAVQTTAEEYPPPPSPK